MACHVLFSLIIIPSLSPVPLYMSSLSLSFSFSNLSLSLSCGQDSMGFIHNILFFCGWFSREEGRKEGRGEGREKAHRRRLGQTPWLAFISPACCIFTTVPIKLAFPVAAMACCWHVCAFGCCMFLKGQDNRHAWHTSTFNATTLAFCFVIPLCVFVCILA